MPIYMHIDGIDGESAAAGYPGWFDVFSFSWGETNTGSGTGGGGGAGRVSMQDFSVMKPSGKGSPKLMTTCASGRHIPAVQVVVTRQRNNGEDVLEAFKLTECLISSYSIGGDAGSAPSESLSLNFAKIEFKQNVFDRTGRLVETQVGSWDQRTGEGG